MDQELKKALHAAVVEAIEAVGFDVFKKTSFFISSSRASSETAKAA